MPPLAEASELWGRPGDGGFSDPGQDLGQQDRESDVVSGGGDRGLISGLLAIIMDA
jgi:hypothetical protein